ncbi:MAG: 4-alpha-glucanotransferase, partial [Candidatus Cloacimonas acidaminovorans]|nr:4-alpha-glucanotransferase [Candidatus Cloacimonas acidaminovorans]
MRKTGILLHISSLPSDFGIGDFGPEAVRFAEYLKAEGYTYWQILPINHCGYGNSPYNPLSAFALNPYFISPELLYQQGYINQLMLEAVKIPRSNVTRYEQVYILKDKMLAQATANWMLANRTDDYIEENAPFLKPYLTFLSLSKFYDDTCWYNWNEEHRHYSEKLYQKVRLMNSSYFNLRAATQAMLEEQLSWFKERLQELGIILIGDLPLYLAYDSAEVWAHPEYFDLDEQGRRLHFAGVPPDAFAEKGQLWGNPLYRWDVLKQDGFQLFMERIKQALGYLDILRLDHFIGYVNFWQVEPELDANGQPVLPKDAIKGSWVRALPEDFFSA